MCCSVAPCRAVGITMSMVFIIETGLMMITKMILVLFPFAIS